MFTPLRTKRLLIRPFTTADTAGFAARRNDPQVAKYQDWTLPYPLEKAEARVTKLVAMEGPQNDEWWMAAVADAESGEVYGDLALHLGWEGRTAEIGYTFAAEHWGKGYAVEAVAALVAYLFEELQVTRVFGGLHPDNIASAQVLERTGFLFEGHTKSSFWVGEENSDDRIYGLTRPDWETWRNRPRQPPAQVGLVEISAHNQALVRKLRTHKTQEQYVAPMLHSFADALFPELVDGYPVVPWMRAVTADGEIVGFVMLALRTEHHPEPFLWRLLIDRLHQRRGIGGRVMELVVDECRRMGNQSLLTSWGTGKGSPEPFHRRQGFVPTGRLVDHETEGRLVIS